MDKRTGEHTNKETRDLEDKRTSAKLQPKRAPCKGGQKQQDKNNDEQENRRTHTHGNKRIRGQENKGNIATKTVPMQGTSKITGREDKKNDGQNGPHARDEC